MTGAVPPSASIMMPNVPDHLRSRQTLPMPPFQTASGHRNVTTCDRSRSSMLPSHDHGETAHLQGLLRYPQPESSGDLLRERQ
jgi:hypothetical protein